MSREEVLTIAEKVRRLLEDKTKCGFNIKDFSNEEKISFHIEKEVEKPPTGHPEQGHMLWCNKPWDHIDTFAPEYVRRGRMEVIEWPKHWMDFTEPSVDRVSVLSDSVEVVLEHDFYPSFMSDYYYAITFPLFKAMFIERKDRMKAARFIPGVIKDIEVFLKTLGATLERHGISWGKPKIADHYYSFLPYIDNPDFEKHADWARIEYSYHGLVRAVFKTTGLSTEEIVNNAMEWAEILTEHRIKYRYGWIPSEERRNCYESTTPFHPIWKRGSRHHYRYLYKWPFESENEKLNKSYMHGLIENLKDRKYTKCYNLDGYRLYYREHGGKGKVIASRKGRLKEVPLEKIGFLKEDFPELWGGEAER